MVLKEQTFERRSSTPAMEVISVMFANRENENTALFLLRWLARILGLAVLVLFALFAFGDNGATNGPNGTELVGLLFFPLGVSAGFLIGWRNELLGGAVSVASPVCFYLVYGLILTGRFPDGIFFFLFTIPGFLFLIYGISRLPWFIVKGISDGKHRVS